MDTALGVIYRSQDWAENDTSATTWQLAFTQTLGGHVLKAGHQGLLAADDRTSFTNDHGFTIRLSNGLRNLITQVISPFTTMTRVSQVSGYVQDSWTSGRLTLHGAVRYDRARSWFPDQHLAATRWRPFEISLPWTAGVNAFTDVTPRAGAAYDVAGDGQTIVRVTAGRYLEGASTTGIYADGNPALALVRIATRNWNDSNRNSVPDCDLTNWFSNGECATSSAIITGLGTLQPSTMFSTDIVSGFGARPSDWNVGASFERRLAPAPAWS